MQVDCVTRFRVPGAEDGAKVWELIRQAGSLDLNSPYSYLMLCDYFRDTCVVAEDNFGIVGFFYLHFVLRKGKTRYLSGKWLWQEPIVKKDWLNQ